MKEIEVKEPIIQTKLWGGKRKKEEESQKDRQRGRLGEGQLLREKKIKKKERESSV